MDFTWFENEEIETTEESGLEDITVLDLTPEKIEVYADSPGVLRKK